MKDLLIILCFMYFFQLAVWLMMFVSTCDGAEPPNGGFPSKKEMLLFLIPLRPYILWCKKPLQRLKALPRE